VTTCSRPPNRSRLQRWGPRSVERGSNSWACPSRPVTRSRRTTWPRSGFRPKTVVL
jgi:hypothetical protein